MPQPAPSFDFVEAQVRKKTFGILTTIDAQGQPHSTGVLYGVAPPVATFALFVLTLDRYAKVRYIRENPRVTLAITFPHRILSFVPANCVTFRGDASIVPFSDSDGVWAFRQRRILRSNVTSVAENGVPVFIRIEPDERVLCYGLGISLNQIRKDHTSAGYKVRVPARG